MPGGAFTAREAYSVLRHVPHDELRLLGFAPEHSHPKDMILRNLLVCPPCARPAIYSSEGSRLRGQNDLTMRLLEILKRSHEVAAGLPDGVDWSTLDAPSDELLERVARLQYEVHMLMNNNARVPKPPGMGRNSSNASGKSLHERLKGKEGRVRGNLMGKRVDHSARCVITPDAYFDCDRVGVPYRHRQDAHRARDASTPTNMAALGARVRAGADERARRARHRAPHRRHGDRPDALRRPRAPRSCCARATWSSASSPTTTWSSSTGSRRSTCTACRRTACASCPATRSASRSWSRRRTTPTSTATR